MKITFIRPNISPMPASDAMEPLVFALLAGLTPPEVELAFYDDRLESIPYAEPTGLVALTVETYTARRAYQIAARFRQQGVPVVLGGYHPTLLPEEALQHADAVVCGDGEELWPQVVADAQRGRLQRVYRARRPPALTGLTLDRRIFAGKRYAPIGLVQYGRGCRYACDFCSVHAFYGNDLRQRPVREVVAEIEAHYRQLIFLVDDNLFTSPAKTEELLRALIPLRIRWVCQTSIDLAANPRLLDLMARSGCLAVLIGFESLDQRNLAQMKKGWNLKQSDYGTAVQRFRERGIMIYGTFIFGYDYDTVDSFDRCLEFALGANFCLANFNPLTPTPGTGLYDRLRRAGRLLYDCWWLDPAYRYGQATFRPRGMTADELTAGCFRARRQFNTYGSILKRAFDFQANCRDRHHLYAFLAGNFITRREIYRKQGVTLGQ